MNDKFIFLYNINLNLSRSLDHPYQLEFRGVFNINFTIELEQVIKKSFINSQVSNILDPLTNQLRNKFKIGHGIPIR